MPTTIFNTAELIQLLEAYVTHDDHDVCLKASTITFVQSHPDFYRRSHLAGHVTASAWVLDTDRTQVLLTHHAKLGRWMQLGGHIEDDPDIHSAALREAREESGLTSVSLAMPSIFDIDIHEIPTTPKAPAHLHYDIRFLLTANRNEPLQITSESRSLAWVPLEKVQELTDETSVTRMVGKTWGMAEVGTAL